MKFATNIGTRHAQQLGLDPAACKEGDAVPEGKADEIRAVCGQASIVGVSADQKVKAAPKPELSEAELEKLTAPEKAKK